MHLKMTVLALAGLGFGGAIPPSGSLTGQPAADVLCPMPVARPDSVKPVPMPVDRTNTAVPMPTDTTACHNPLFVRK
jgi:hypothetical protein